MKISVSIVNYKVPKLLLQCIESLQLSLEGIESEIIVVDNHSEDGSKELVFAKFPKVKWIANNENVGFGKAHNQAIKQAKGEYVVIVNPDVQIAQDTFRNLLLFAKSKEKLGIIGVQMKNAKEEFLPESKRNLPSMLNAIEKQFGLDFLPKSKKYYALQLPNYETGRVEVLSGAFMFLPLIVYKDLGGFDERYFMYGEDIDLSLQSLRKGYENYYKGDVVITHLKGKSARKNRKDRYYFYDSMKLYIDKNYTNPLLKSMYKGMVQWAYYRQKRTKKSNPNT